MSSQGTIAQQNDPHELLEVFDGAGRPTGRAKSRAGVHIDGDWHQAFHCWIVRSGPQIVLQRRSAFKDTYPLAWDAAAAGHWRFGETAEEAAREIAEELGLAVSFERLRYVGRERAVATFDSGLIDREHHQVYVLHSDAPLESYRPDPREVSAVAAFPGRELVALMGGRRARLRAVEGMAVAADGALTATAFEIARAEVVPYSAARLGRILGSSRADC